MKGIFIIGTDTGVGKTYVAERLLSFWVKKGKKVGFLKPFESGHAKPSDTTRLWRAMGERGKPPAFCSPYAFPAPLAPAQAAKLANISINLAKISAALKKAQQAYDILLVEGCGGLLVPLLPDNPAFTVESLALAMGYPVLLVARAGLGTLNHTLLTVRRMAQVNLPLCGIVLNESKKSRAKDPAFFYNPDTLRSLIAQPIWGPLAFGQDDPRIWEEITRKIFVRRVHPNKMTTELGHAQGTG
jgi:dethiobiotin synthetase